MITTVEVAHAQSVDAGIVDGCFPHQDGGVTLPEALVYCPYPLVIEWDDEGFKAVTQTGDAAFKAERGLDEANKKLIEIEELIKKHRQLKANKALLKPVINDARTMLPQRTP